MVPFRRTGPLFISVGDASGDLHGAQLVEAVRRYRPEIRWYGLGGPRMRQAGVALAVDTMGYSAMGWVSASRVILPMLATYRALRVHLARCRPRAVVLIDFGAFNARLGRLARHLGIPTFYFMPPGSWNRAYPRIRPLSQVADRFASPFPWHARALSESGADAHYVGHPILDTTRETPSREEVRQALGIASDTPCVVLLPGSRRQEIVHILPRMLAASRQIVHRFPRVRFLLAPAITVSQGMVDRLQQRFHTRWEVRPGESSVCMQAADVALAASGTVTLELACRRVPSVVVYAGSALDRVQYALVRSHLRFVALPNIILDRPVFPELLGDEAQPGRLAHEVMRLLSDPSAREVQQEEMSRVRDLLGRPGAIHRTARLLIDLLERDPHGQT